MGVVIVVPFFVVDSAFYGDDVFDFMVLEDVGDFGDVAGRLLDFDFVLGFFLLSDYFFEIAFVWVFPVEVVEDGHDVGPVVEY